MRTGLRGGRPLDGSATGRFYPAALMLVHASLRIRGPVLWACNNFQPPLLCRLPGPLSAPGFARTRRMNRLAPHVFVLALLLPIVALAQTPSKALGPAP